MSKDTYEAAEEAFGGDRELQKRVLVSKLTPKQKLVYDAIQENPEAANDDAALLTAVWHKEGWEYTVGLLTNLKIVSRPETLSRRRRELFNMGLIEYSDKKLKERERAYKAERDKASPIPPQLRYEAVTVDGEKFMKPIRNIE